MMEKKQTALPGDKLAVSEEYLPGPHVYDDSGLLRALVVGTVQRDKNKMEISVKPAAKAGVLKVGDLVTGQVEAAATSTGSIRIYYVNGAPTDKGFTGTVMLRSREGGRGARGGPPVKLGDIVRCRIQSMMNGIIHLSLDENETGVVFAFCGNCGRPMQRGGANRAKCDECGNVEERKLAADFGKVPVRP
jgi:exosome complex component CSL4